MNIKDSLRDMLKDDSNKMELFYVISIDKTTLTLEGIQLTSEIDVSKFDDSTVDVDGVPTLKAIDDIRLKYKDYIIKDISYSLNGIDHIFTPTVNSTVLCSKLLDGRYSLIITSNTASIELTKYAKKSGDKTDNTVEPNTNVTENIDSAMEKQTVIFGTNNVEVSKSGSVYKARSDEYDIEFNSKLRSFISKQGSALILDDNAHLLASPTGRIRISRNVPTTFINEKLIGVSKINDSNIEGEKGNSEAFNFLDTLYKTLMYNIYKVKNIPIARDLLSNPDTIAKCTLYGITDIYDVYNTYVLTDNTIKKGSAEQFLIVAKKVLDKLNEFQGKIDPEKLKDGSIYRQFEHFREKILNNIVKPEMTAARLETYIQGSLYTNFAEYPDVIVWSSWFKKIYTYIAPFYNRNTANRPMTDIERLFVTQAIKDYKLSLEKYKNKDNKQEVIDVEIQRVREIKTVTSTYSLKNVVDKQNKIHTDLTKLNEDVIKDLVTDLTALQTALSGLGVPFVSQLVTKQATYLGTLDSINKIIGVIGTKDCLLNETEELLKK